MNPELEFARKTALAYNALCRPLCQELNLPQTAFDILMFLGNNPSYKTASDIVEIRHIKANLVSVNVDRLVREGYLMRQEVKGDRRKTELICTEKAQSVIRRGQKLQRTFFDRLLENMDEQTRNAFFAAMKIMEKNIDMILEETKYNEFVINGFRHIFCRHGSRSRNRFCRFKCRCGHKSHADHIPAYGSLHGGRYRPVL